MSAHKTVDCGSIASTLGSLTIAVSIVPLIFNIITFTIIGYTIFRMKNMSSICDGIAANAHWLSRTAGRVGISDSAKQELAAYARSKPEFQRLFNIK